MGQRFRIAFIPLTRYRRRTQIDRRTHKIIVAQSELNERPEVSAFKPVGRLNLRDGYTKF